MLAIVGNRLDEEITDAFALELTDLLSVVPQAFLAFVGTFPGYARLAQRHPDTRDAIGLPGLSDRTSRLSTNAVMRILNPPRYGAGSSAAFALAMGLPVLTRANGDVANIAGPRFVFDSFDEITRFVARSLIDPAHRHEWAAMARARFGEISDREAMLRTIVQQVATKAALRIGA